MDGTWLRVYWPLIRVALILILTIVLIASVRRIAEISTERDDFVDECSNQQSRMTCEEVWDQKHPLFTLLYRLSR